MRVLVSACSVERADECTYGTSLGLAMDEYYRSRVLDT